MTTELKPTTQREDGVHWLVEGYCPAHGDWKRREMLKLSPVSLSQAECPECSRRAPKALSFDTVKLEGVCERHGAWQNNVAQFAEEHLRGRCPHCDLEAQKKKDDAERRNHASSRQRNRQAKLDELLEQAAIPRRFLSRTFENYVVETPEQTTVRDRAKRYAHKFDQVMTLGASMIFHGAPGTGKNHLAAAIANYVIPKFGVSVLFITVYELMQRVRSTYNAGADNERMTEDKLLKFLAGIDLLIIDEIGVQLGTKHEEVILTDLINRRYADVRPTILLSNLGRDELEKQLGSRIIDRMEEGGGGSMAFPWGSYRAKVQADKNLSNPKYTPPKWLTDDDEGEPA